MGVNCFKSKMTASTRAGLSDPVVMELVLQGDMAKILDWLICLIMGLIKDGAY